MFYCDVNKNIEWLDKYLNIDISFDIGKRELKVGEKKAWIYYVTGLVSQDSIIKVLTTLINTNPCEDDYIQNRIPAIQVEKEKELEHFSSKILSGLIGIIIENENYGLIIDLRKYPGREPGEPDTEKVVRGSRDGYTENIIINLGLTRRRIRVGGLINELFRVGTLSKTDVSLTYIKGIADQKLVSELKEKINSIKVKELSMTDKALEELICKTKLNPYPLVRYTERPDVVAAHLFQGRVAIFVDNSPSVILAPTTLFDHLSHAEEYRQAPLIGTFLRLVRILGILVSIFLIPIWLLMIRGNMPEWFFYHYEGYSESMPIILQILFALIGVELLRMASIHTPNSLSTSMGIIAAILLGDIAIDIGLFSRDIVLFVSLSQIGYYSTPSYEISLSNKISSIFITLSTYFFNLLGFIGSTLIWIVFLAFTKSFGKPYLYPLFPFSFKEIIKTIIRMPKKEE